MDNSGKESKVVTYTVNYDDAAPAIADVAYDSQNALVTEGDMCTVAVRVTDDFDTAPTVERLVGEDEWEQLHDNQGDGRYLFEITGNGDYALRFTDHAGNVAEETISVNFYGKPVLDVETTSTEGIAWTGEEDKPCVVAIQDESGAALELAVDGNALSLYNLPAGDYAVAVGYADDDEFSTRTIDITQEAADARPPVVLQAVEDGKTDVFFAQSVGQWTAAYKARHNGLKDGWEGTRETVSLGGKNRLADVFVGAATDANVLLLTDDANGDTLFVDDLYTELPGVLEEQQARIAQIKEIRAGAGADVIDLTSQRFAYVGSGMVVRGGLGDDVIWANVGGNWLFGDAGNDRLVGASGDDVIVGGAGDDALHGGGGDDIFVFGENWGKDTVAQCDGGTVTLWFKEDTGAWDADALTYTDGENSVKVAPGTAVSLKFGDDGGNAVERYNELLAAGAFADATSERIFEDKSKGMLA